MCAQQIRDDGRNVECDGAENPSRRQVLRTGVALLPYIAPVVLSFTARSGSGCAPVSPSPFNNGPGQIIPMGNGYGGASGGGGGTSGGTSGVGFHGSPHNPGP